MSQTAVTLHLGCRCHWNAVPKPPPTTPMRVTRPALRSPIAVCAGDRFAAAAAVPRVVNTLRRVSESCMRLLLTQFVQYPKRFGRQHLLGVFRKGSSLRLVAALFKRRPRRDIAETSIGITRKERVCKRRLRSNGLCGLGKWLTRNGDQHGRRSDGNHHQLPRNCILAIEVPRVFRAPARLRGRRRRYPDL